MVEYTLHTAVHTTQPHGNVHKAMCSLTYVYMHTHIRVCGKVWPQQITHTLIRTVRHTHTNMFTHP